MTSIPRQRVHRELRRDTLTGAVKPIQAPADDRDDFLLASSPEQRLEDGFRLTPAQVPFGLRQEAWNVLLPLTSDSHAGADEEEEKEAESEPATTAINTTRGEAMHAVMRYLIWVKEHVKQAAKGRSRKKVGTREMPEARSVLEAHLDLARDSSLAIRSVYGGPICFGWRAPHLISSSRL